ncbi:Uncharacterized protein TCM_026955 [Theobroma cacao]|uniref:Uncharacterized protein n=1 Tax=Theobroma cacao TaxID=3641 RepID=A0A061G8U7_THECC|nr:Uncharacterized protein TCM_026955 [Theobroma cacao]
MTTHKIVVVCVELPVKLENLFIGKYLVCICKQTLYEQALLIVLLSSGTQMLQLSFLRLGLAADKCNA